MTFFTLWTNSYFQSACRNWCSCTKCHEVPWCFYFLHILKAFLVGLLWVAFVLLDGDWYVCCKNDGSKQQVQLACKAEANITDNERVIIEELKNSSQVSASTLDLLYQHHFHIKKDNRNAVLLITVAFILPFCERCKCCEEVSCCFNRKHLIEELIFTEEEMCWKRF
ncbi:hypothetical protein F7725_001286 [Dissostichus mawsoni]|uniref:Uncharacterized protein n=1 Tax=Dissostichus mawsoni TaxID=36200 RepID=A0A7J5ZIW4_DISMA|nr:hypothetical protein F7725_001286 [Dissostichus mawsoni]